MEIIKTGSLLIPTRDCTCEYCESIIRLMPRDILHRESWGGDFNCPHCGYTNLISLPGEMNESTGDFELDEEEADEFDHMLFDIVNSGFC